MTDELQTAIEEHFECFGASSIRDLGQYGNSVCARGAFGDITLALRTGDAATSDDDSRLQHVVAVKTFRQATEASSSLSVEDGNKNPRQRRRQLRSDVIREISALQRLQPHAHIVQLVGLFPTSTTTTTFNYSLSLAFAYCPTDLALSLEWRRRTYRPPLPLDLVRRVARDVLDALQHCHTVGHLVHRDIKPGNLLISGSGRVQLCDFGLARSIATDSNNKNNNNNNNNMKPQRGEGLGTLYYRPPELLLGSTSDLMVHPSVDLYSAGLVLVELLTNGRVLWPGTNELDQLGRIFSDLGTPSDTHWPGATQLTHGRQFLQFFAKNTTPRPWSELVPRASESPHLFDLLAQLVALDPAQRISSRAACQHPWFQDAVMAERAEVLQELVPPELDEPILLSGSSSGSGSSSNNNDDNVAIRQTLALAARRKTLLSRLDAKW